MFPLDDLLKERGVLVLDGGLATELERQGHDLDHDLWSARFLLEDPDSIAAVHRAYLEAGADVITTAAYQASIPGLMEIGLNARQARTAYMDALRIARGVCDEFSAQKRFVAASIGPYGAFLADGAEYRGHYAASDAQIEAFHRPRIELLAEATERGEGPDLLAIETIPSVPEARLILRILKNYPKLCAWLSFTCSGTETCEGQPIESCAELCEDVPQILAVGVNCSSPLDMPELLARLLAASSKPLVCYPNSGESYEAQSRSWSGASVFTKSEDEPREWLRRGVKLIGGCCRTTPKDIAQLVRLRKTLRD